MGLRLIRLVIPTLIGIIIIFSLTTYYLLTILNSVKESTAYLLHAKNDTDPFHINSLDRIHSAIYEQFQTLHRPRTHLGDRRTISTLQSLNRDNDNDDFVKFDNVTYISDLWSTANAAVKFNTSTSKLQLVDFESKNFSQIYWSLRFAPIVTADIDNRGSQLKLLLTLTGGKKVIFKPKWYEIDRIIDPPVYGGKDRYFGEIVAFILSIILNWPLVPISVKRQVSLQRDILPVATPALIETGFFRPRSTEYCIYGRCTYCARSDPICTASDTELTGTAIFNIDNVKFTVEKSPWRRTYKKFKSAIWELYPDQYCQNLSRMYPKKRLLDFVDTALFDFLIQNGDRHHYELLQDEIVLLDNGKAFGNPYIQHLDILAPLYQCCLIRRSTWTRLIHLSDGQLRSYLKIVKEIDTLLTEEHLKAMEERLLLIFATVGYCKKFSRMQFI